MFFFSCCLSFYDSASGLIDWFDVVHFRLGHPLLEIVHFHFALNCPGLEIDFNLIKAQYCPILLIKWEIDLMIVLFSYGAMVDILADATKRAMRDVSHFAYGTHFKTSSIPSVKAINIIHMVCLGRIGNIQATECGGSKIVFNQQQLYIHLFFLHFMKIKMNPITFPLLILWYKMPYSTYLIILFEEVE